MNTYELRHVTRYEYEKPVFQSYGRAHLKPGFVEGQRCLDTRLDVEPVPAETSDHRDYFGNTSTFFCVRTEHTTLSVSAISHLEVDRVAADPDELDAVSWSDVAASVSRHPELSEFVLPSPRIRMSSDVHEYAASILTPGRGLGQTLHDLVGRIYRDFEYKFGATDLDTTQSQLLRKRQGVCQDFAHLGIACLRSMGLAARYVSGYLETQPPPGQVKLQGADASHAWLSVWVPATQDAPERWVDIDPTNDQFADDRYLVVAHGREYTDVPPLKGVIVTDSRKSSMHVGVDVIRLN